MRKMLSELKNVTLLFQCYLLMGEFSFLYNARLNRNNLSVSVESAITTWISVAGTETAARNFISLSQKLADNTEQVIFYSIFQRKHMDRPTTSRAHTSRWAGYFCGAELRAGIPKALRENTANRRKHEGYNQPGFKGISLQTPWPQASPHVRHSRPRCDIYSDHFVFKQCFFHSCLMMTTIFKIEFHDGCCTVRWEKPPDRIRGEWLELTLATQLHQSIFFYWWWLEDRRKCGSNKTDLGHLHLNLPTILPRQNPFQSNNLQDIIKQRNEKSTAWNKLPNYTQKT